MPVTLEEAKIYLRVDTDDEDALIESFLQAAEDICEGVLRFPLADFEAVPEPVKQAVLYATAQFYELRESININILTDIVRKLLFAYRKEGW
ncbi:MAG: head-tail connector protein [Bacillota bacterium]|nr:head-tail connector protein [Bacillota bacterium]